MDHLRGFARREGQGARSGGVVVAGGRGAVAGGIGDRNRRTRRSRQRDGKGEVAGSAVAFRDRGVGNGQRRQRRRRRIVVDDGGDTGGAPEDGPGSVAQHDAEGFVRLAGRIGRDRDRDGLGLLAGRERHRAALAGEVRTARRSRLGVVVHRHGSGRRRRQAEHEGCLRPVAAVVRQVPKVELDGRQVSHLVLVDGVPVVLKDAAGVAGVGIPRPVGPAHAGLAGRDIRRAVVVEVARHVGGDGLEPWRVFGVGEVGAELADEDGGDTLPVDVAPHLVELGGEAGGKIVALEPCLRPHRVRVVMRRIDQLVVDGEFDRPVLNAHEVAAPPVGVALIVGDAFDKDQPVGIDLADGVAGAFGRRGPVGQPTAAPGAGERFIVQVGADHRRIVGIARRQCLPIGDPLRLAVLGVVPQAVGRGACAGVVAMVIEDDPKPDLAGIFDDRIHDLHGREALQARVRRVVDVGRGRAVQCVVGERQPDGVEAQLHHLVHHVLVVACPQAVRRQVRILEAEPVHAGDLHRVAGRIDDLIARGAEPARRRAAAAAGIPLAHRGVADAERGRRRGIVVVDGAHAGAVGDGGARRAAQGDDETLVGFRRRITDRGDLDGLLRLAGCEDERARAREVIAAGHRRAVGGSEVYAHRRGRSGRQADREAALARRAGAALGEGGIGDRQRRLRRAVVVGDRADRRTVRQRRAARRGQRQSDRLIAFDGGVARYRDVDDLRRLAGGEGQGA